MDVEKVEVRKVECVPFGYPFDDTAVDPIWRIEIDGYCADFEFQEAAENFAAAINARLAALEASPVKELLEALEPFAKMADALLDIDQEIVITNESLRRTSDLPNYYLATRDLRRARTLVSQYGGKA